MKTLTLGGRQFVALDEPTIERDFWLIRQLREAGLQEVRIGEDEDPDVFALRLLDSIIQSKTPFLLLGAFLLPKGTDSREWSPELAERTAAFIAKLTDPEDKQQVQTQLCSVLLGFFVSGLSSLVSSRGSSLPSQEPGRGSEPAPAVN